MNRIEKIINGIGCYNPELKLYSLKRDGNAWQKIFDYADKQSSEDWKRLRDLNRQTEVIMEQEEIGKLILEGYIKI
jgi:hypothetical protein